MSYGRLVPIPSVAGWRFSHNQTPGAISAQLVALGVAAMPGYNACYISPDRLVVGLLVPLDHPHAATISAALALLDITPL